jgi:UPF0042 nucleotide-binding protein
LRPLTGQDDAVSEFVLGQSLSQEFLDRLYGMLDLLVPAYRSEGKSYLTVAIGCTGGRHRSVAIAEQLCKWLLSSGYRPRLTHRDIAR